MIVHKFIVHVLDKTVDEPVINDFEGRINPHIDKFLQKSIKKVIKDDLLRKAKFRNYNDNLIKQLCDRIIYDEKSFIENSKEIAAYLFDVMKEASDIESSDLVVCLFTEKDQKYVAIVKYDYKDIFNHSIEFEDDKFNIQMVQNNAGILETTKPKQVAIVGVNGLNDEYDLRVLDVEAEKKNEISSFIEKFLDVRKVDDDTYKTKMFEAYTSNYITNAFFVDDVIKAEDIRQVRDYMLLNHQVMDIDKFLKQALKEENEIKDFKEYLEDKGFNKDFNIDRKYIEKKLKNRNIKTDTGINIKLNREISQDPLVFSMKRNENGTCDIVIKGVKFFEEK
ncbi:nucleoid-associated protein [Romboutsia hominis]|uniref:nucleoid-associated protein n=1 Tax=Romboutsia hominis TaxID=1507512 RepID=UPI000B831A5F|nr:nucleoid-associated protein [Romboutsia hominis]